MKYKLIESSMFRKYNPIFIIHALLLSLLYSLVFSGNVLGFLNLYHGWVVFFISALTFFLILIIYIKTTSQDFINSFKFDPNSQNLKPKLLEILLLLSGSIIIFVLVIFPLSMWPISSITNQLPYDSALYHFPKAINLFQSGSIWNQSSIAYWEYPFGYENLLSFTLLLTGKVNSFGIVHAAIAFFLILNIFLIGRRYTKLSSGTLLFLIVIFLLSKNIVFLLDYFPWIKINQYRWVLNSNPWAIFGNLFNEIGKNDLYLGSAMLSMIVHMPISVKHQSTKSANPVGLAMGTMLVFSIKPNGALFAVPLWILMLVWIIKQSENRNLSGWARIFLFAVLIIPGLSWAFRNYKLLGQLFPDSTMSLQAKSIFSLFSQLIGNGLPLSGKIVLILIITSIFLLIVQKKFTRIPLIILASLILIFIFTPASANFSEDGTFLVIQWRFGLALLGYLLILMLYVSESFILRVYQFILDSRIFFWITILLVFSFTLGLTFERHDLLKIYPQKQAIIQNYFSEPVGSSGYYSAYDYIQKNFHGAKIRIDNGLPFYAYGEGFENFPTVAPYPLWSDSLESIKIDTYLIFTDENHPYPDYLASQEFLANWVIVYEDEVSRIYRLSKEY
jgi:hypothetical protein